MGSSRTASSLVSAVKFRNCGTDYWLAKLGETRGRGVGRVGKELSTSRVVAGQTLLVGAANISLTPWQTNLTFVRASSRLLPFSLGFLLLVSAGFSEFFSRRTRRGFSKFPSFAVPFPRWARDARGTFLSIVINSSAFLPLFNARFLLVALSNSLEPPSHILFPI